MVIYPDKKSLFSYLVEFQRGSNPQPGEITLAHRGVLFLDELPEFARAVLESLREPLETGEVAIARAKARLKFPARFQLIGAMNPCPCGHLGDSSKHCRCTEEQINKYRNRLSGPLLDRIDLHVGVDRLPTSDLLETSTSDEPSSAEIAKQVQQARDRQLSRAGKLNAALNPEETQRDCCLKPTEKKLLIQAAERLGLSARSSHRVLRTARSIADLAAASTIDAQHLAEALSFRGTN